MRQIRDHFAHFRIILFSLSVHTHKRIPENINAILPRAFKKKDILQSRYSLVHALKQMIRKAFYPRLRVFYMRAGHLFYLRTTQVRFHTVKQFYFAVRKFFLKHRKKRVEIIHGHVVVARLKSFRAVSFHIIAQYFDHPLRLPPPVACIESVQPAKTARRFFVPPAAS